jgi:membrane protein implicated in regulation of membrane protease activity
MPVRDFLLRHTSLPLGIMVSCMALTVGGAWALQTPWWWLMGCALVPVAFIAWMAWLAVRRTTRDRSNSL